MPGLPHDAPLRGVAIFVSASYSEDASVADSGLLLPVLLYPGSSLGIPTQGDASILTATLPVLLYPGPS